MTTIDITTYGASPSLADNTDAIQHALAAASPGDTVYVPVGVFLVDPVRSVLMRSSVNLQIDGVLQAFPGALDKPNAIVNMNGAVNIVISGTGSIVGERDAHPLAGNRAGFCVAIIGSSNISVTGLTMRDAWADGIYVQDSKVIVIDGVTCTNCGRNGMSIISAQTMAVTNSTFSLTNSTSPMPQAGIDIEPDLPSQSLLDIAITKNRFVQNKGAGVSIAFQPAANRARIHIAGNTFDQNYKDGNGQPIGGMDTFLFKLLYALCRWVPGYNYWTCPTEYTLS
jgi:polygalacturonase